MRISEIYLITLAPWFSSSMAYALPMPDAAPVTRATRPFISILLREFFLSAPVPTQNLKPSNGLIKSLYIY